MAAARDPGASARALFAHAPVLLPALAASAVLLFVTVRGDEVFGVAVTWQACNMLLVALLGLCLVAVPAAGRPARATVVAAALFGAYALWSYASIAWADQKADAWDGANRTALYAIVFATFALWPLGRRGATLIVGAIGAFVGGLAVVALAKAAAADDLGDVFFNGRLGWPLQYPNGTVAVWFTGFWPCAALAARREVHPFLRGLFLAFAGVLAATAMLGQSRGWLFAVPIVAVVAIGVTPGRVRLAWTLIAVGLATLAVGPSVVDVHDAFGQGRPGLSEIDSAVRNIAIASFVLFAAGVAVGYLERRVRVPAAAGRRAGVAMAVAALAVLVAGFGVFVAREGNPVTWVDERWEEFKDGPQPTDAEGARFTQALGSNRYDFWKVAWDGFERRPIVGIGADNFRHDYQRDGTSDEEPYYPHSVVIRTLEQTGLIGAVLLFGAIAAAAWGAGQAIRERRGVAAAAAAAGLTSFAYFLVHGAVDWFWELPAIGGLAFALLGVAAGLRPRPAIHPRARRAREPFARGWAPLGATVVGVGLLLAAIAPPLLATLDTKRARDAVNDDPARAGEALDMLDRAAGLNPHSPIPRLYSAAIVIAFGQPERAAPYYRDAIERDPSDQYSHLALGALESTAGRRARATRLLRRAAELSPRDPLARELLEEVEAGRRIGLEDVRREFQNRREARG